MTGMAGVLYGCIGFRDMSSELGELVGGRTSPMVGLAPVSPMNKNNLTDNGWDNNATSKFYKMIYTIFFKWFEVLIFYFDFGATMIFDF